ncbi:unnamed protein product [Calypogeia fissa]
MYNYWGLDTPEMSPSISATEANLNCLNTVLSRRIIEPHGLLSNKEMIKEAIRLAESAPNSPYGPQRSHCKNEDLTKIE